MPQKVSDVRLEKLRHIIEALRGTNLDLNWILSIAALSAQELAIKKKLDEFGVSCPAEEDFQKLANKLREELSKRGLDGLDILLSIARSYRHIRAKLLHDAHKSKISEETMTAIVYNTEALVKSLFKKPAITKIKKPTKKPIIAKIPQFVESINRRSIKKSLKDFTSFNLEKKKRIVKTILNEISLLNWSEISANERLFQFLRLALDAEKEMQAKIELFSVFFSTFSQRTIPYGRDKLLSIVAEFTRTAPIKKWISKTKQTDWLISEFECSNSFATAGTNAEIVANLAPILNEKQIDEIVKAALSNNQIYYSFAARRHLMELLPFWEGKVKKSKLEELRKKLES
ncbi:hypothetical protein ES706_00035 [subsurface metagenome]|nr:hypothetical protein [Hadesarchaea archaeon]